jgi:cytosine/adenosine deaminase-related metal-dependent hydrolase
VFPVEGPPIENGVVTIWGDRIADVRQGPVTGAVDLGNAAIIPGLVNAHTHLEFSDLVRPLGPPQPFGAWLRGVIAFRRARSGSVVPAIEQGLRECAACGVTTVGEIATSADSVVAFDEQSPRGVAFREAIALDPELVDEQLALVRSYLDAEGAPVAPSLEARSNVFRGVSPHAPYSVAPDLFEELVRLAEGGAYRPLAFHLGETREELELLARGAGPLVDLFRELGFWRDGALPTGRRPLDYLLRMQDLQHALIVHGNYLEADEIRFMGERPHMAVVYCPRTHAYFGHAPHPWREMLRRGVSLALGTDSRASNPDLNLWSEVLFLRGSCRDVSSEMLLRLATQDGARALGLEFTGSLALERTADLAVVSLEGCRETEPHDLLLHPAGRVVATMRDGRWIHPAGE